MFQQTLIILGILLLIGVALFLGYCFGIYFLRNNIKGDRISYIRVILEELSSIIGF